MTDTDPPIPPGDVLLALDTSLSRLQMSAGFASVYFVAAIPALTGREVDLVFAAASAVLAAGLVALSTIDAVSLRLPDMLTLTLTASGLAICWWLGTEPIAYRVAAAALGYATLYAVSTVYLKLRNRHGLGLGDAKLFAAAGAWVGYEGLPGVLLWASVSALLVVAVVMKGAVSARTRLPFGPFLAFAIWIVWLYGPPFSSV